jgi:RNA ligase (TIGR02306 family)
LKNNERNRDNLYVRSTRALIERIDAVQKDDVDGAQVPHFMLGETYGPGVQDLAYGKALGLRVFAAAFGYRGEQQYQDWSVVEGSLKDRFGFETVPVLYRGPFSEAIMRLHTDGTTSMGEGHIREGIVMLPEVERIAALIGRVCLKSVSADYLTRKGGTEFN